MIRNSLFKALIGASDPWYAVLETFRREDGQLTVVATTHFSRLPVRMQEEIELTEELNQMLRPSNGFLSAQLKPPRATVFPP